MGKQPPPPSAAPRAASRCWYGARQPRAVRRTAGTVRVVAAGHHVPRPEGAGQGVRRLRPGLRRRRGGLGPGAAAAGPRRARPQPGRRLPHRADPRRRHLAAIHSYTTVFWWCAAIFTAGAVICGALLRTGPLTPPATIPTREPS